MRQQEMFGNAYWVDAGGGAAKFHVLRGRFCIGGVKSATLRVLGLGFFHCYINGELKATAPVSGYNNGIPNGVFAGVGMLDWCYKSCGEHAFYLDNTYIAAE